MLKRFIEDRSGAIAPMFAIAAIPLIASTGAAIDYSRAYQQRTIIQDALDAAALAANKLVGSGTEAQILAEAQKFYSANTVGRVPDPPAFTMTVDKGSVQLDTSLSVPTYFLGLVGIDDLAFDIMSKTVAGSATYEIALVLDTTGSMSGSKISTLRTAATNLVNTIFTANQTNPKPDPVKFAVVPFAASVNVGTSYANASWMGNGTESWTYNGKTYTNYENFSGPTNRFTLFDQLKNASWGGCVEERRMPNDVTDTAATVGDKSTLFVPMFAPDEPDDRFCKWTTSWRGGTSWSCSSQSYSFPNDYTSDYGGSQGKVEYADRQAAQAGTAKYDGVSLGSSYTGMGKGPNLSCTSEPVLPLTTNQSSVLAKISALDASGNTNILSGFMWGWHMLSPVEPFAEGRAEDTVDNHKILILMTDGSNTYTGQGSSGNFNNSTYAAFSYSANDHLGTTSSSSSTIEGKMDERTLQACANLKANGNYTIYTVAFQVSDKAAKKILADCASDAAKAFDSGSNSELLAAFNSIAEDITTLRIAQ